MTIKLIKASHDDLENILYLQKESFKDLLNKYRDFDTNPGNENINDIVKRYEQSFTDYLLIQYIENVVGAVRVVRNEMEQVVRISPIFILPQYQGKGISQKTFTLIERKYDWAKLYKLDTILQEEKLCYLYEKIGYKRTGVYEEIKAGMTIVYYEKSMI